MTMPQATDNRRKSDDCYGTSGIATKKKAMNIEVIPPKFDLDGFYKHELEIVIRSERLDYGSKLTKLKTLVQRAYEQGIMDAKRDNTYFDDYGGDNGKD